MQVKDRNGGGLANTSHASFTSSLPLHVKSQPTHQKELPDLLQNKSMKLAEVGRWGGSDDGQSNRSMLQYDTQKKKEDLS